MNHMTEDINGPIVFESTENNIENQQEKEVYNTIDPINNGPSYYPLSYYLNAVPDYICDWMLEESKKYLEACGHDAQTGDGLVNPHIRRTKIAWIEKNVWIYGVINQYVNMANEYNFEYILDRNCLENIQITQYTEGDSGYYGWHIDFDPRKNHYSNKRKLSVSLQLSHPDEYEGGELQLRALNNEIYIAPKQRGTLIVFDSRNLHQVTPITKGERISLVSWAHGPALK